jgi:hypothetical protein
MRQYPFVTLTSEMIDEATALVPATRVMRTVASKIDTLAGHLGEFAFAEHFYGSWRQHRVGRNRGQVDFPGIEIKTSAFPIRDTLNLLVREDYAAMRKPPFYVQVILDVPDKKADAVAPGTKAYVCGFASADEVDRSPLRDFGSKFGGSGDYRCHYIAIRDLHPIEELPQAYDNYAAFEGRLGAADLDTSRGRPPRP